MGAKTKPLRDFITDGEDVHYNPIHDIMNVVKGYIDSTPYGAFVEHIKKSVIGQDTGVEAMCLQVYKWLLSVASGNIKSHNTILAAPSGSGKTAFYYALKNELSQIKIPVINFDASSITPVGYVGNDYSGILDELCAVDCKCQGVGICFLDEIDKIFSSSVDSSGRDFHKEAQSCLLKLLEGSEFRKRDKDGGNMYVNTANTLFIGMGAFQDVRERHIQVKKNTIGFGYSVAAEEKEHSLYSPISDKDIIDYGAQVELIGRFEKIVNYSKLDYCAIAKIIKKNAKDLLPVSEWNITLSDNAISELMKYADDERGVRFIKAKISEAIDKVLPSIFAEDFDEKIYEITVNSLENISYVSKKKELPALKVEVEKEIPTRDSQWETINKKSSEICDGIEGAPFPIPGKDEDLPMLKINVGDILFHKVFGEGKVVKKSDSKFTVCFNQSTEREFICNDNIAEYFTKKE